MSDNIRVIAKFMAKPGQVDDLRELLVSLIEPTRAEEGCVLYVLWQDRARPAEFTFVEEWTSKAALDRHLESPHMKDATQRFDGLLAEPLQVDSFDAIA